MILLILLLVVVVAVACAGLLGIGVLSEDHRRERVGLLAAASAPVVLLVAVVLVAVVVLGVGGPGPMRGSSPEAPPATPATRAPSQGAPAPPPARLEPVTPDLPVVVIEAADEDRFSVYRHVSGLVPGAVVRVQARGFEEFERGHIEQCVTELGRQTACIGSYPVQFDEEGSADLQFSVRDDFAPGGCRAGQATCLVRVRGDQSGRRGTAQTVLVDRVAPGRVTVKPATGLADGQTVEVTVTGFPPGSSAVAVLCAPPDVYDARRCQAPERNPAFAIDAAGSGRTTLAVAEGRLGADAALCGPRRLCGIAVVATTGFIAAPPTPVAFSLGPGVAYDAGRVVAGVLIAVVLAAIALLLITRTDWTKPTEAGTPAMDRADLRAGEDLDDLFGTDEELDARDPIPW